LAHSVRAPTYLKRVGTFGALETVSHKHVPNTRAAARQAVAHDNAATALLANTLATARRWLRSSLLSARFPARISILPSRLANAGQGGLRWRDVSVYIAAQALVGWPQFSAAD